MAYHGAVRWLIVAIVVVFAATGGLLLWLHTPPKPHSVTLSWQAPAVKPGSRIVGYNVYRRAEDGLPFVKIADRVPEPHYEDPLVASGRTYVYAVTSVDQSGRESRFSQIARATIP